MPKLDKYDCIIIGGGFFGAYIALQLKEKFKSILVLEQESDLLLHASLNNQARVHNGYHYPRSLSTALSSSRHFKTFCNEFKAAIKNDFAKYYAIANIGSKTSSTQFYRLFKQFDIFIESVPNHIKAMFNKKLVSDVFLTREYAFDAAILREILKERLESKNIEIATNTQAVCVREDKLGLCVEISQVLGNSSLGMQCSSVASFAKGTNHQFANLSQNLQSYHSHTAPVRSTSPYLQNTRIGDSTIAESQVVSNNKDSKAETTNQNSSKVDSTPCHTEALAEVSSIESKKDTSPFSKSQYDNNAESQADSNKHTNATAEVSWSDFKCFQTKSEGSYLKGSDQAFCAESLKSTQETPQKARKLHAPLIINCTYAGINHLLQNSHLPPLPLKFEMTEMALVNVPVSLQDISVTIMDGAFFSLMPYPSKDCYTLSHVRYTPHFAWQDCSLESKLKAYNLQDSNNPLTSPYAILQAFKQNATSNFPLMKADAKRYMPILESLEYLDSLYEIKTLQIQNEIDDGRPIIFAKDYGLKGFCTIMGGKIDNIYEIAELLDMEL